MLNLFLCTFSLCIIRGSRCDSNQDSSIIYTRLNSTFQWHEHEAASIPRQAETRLSFADAKPLYLNSDPNVWPRKALDERKWTGKRQKVEGISYLSNISASLSDNLKSRLSVGNLSANVFSKDGECQNGSYANLTELNGCLLRRGRNTDQGTQKNWEWYAEATIVPILCTLGLVGNTLSFLVMSSSSYNCRAFSLYLRSLAVTDSLTLISELVQLIDTLSGKTFLRFQTTVTCKLSDFFMSVVYLMSSWLIVAFTIDRLLAVCQPLKRQILCSLERIRVIIGLIVFLTSASQVFRLVLVERLDRPGRSPCHASLKLRPLYFRLDYFLYGTLLRFFIPFIIILICNSLIISNIVRMSPIKRASATWEKRKTNLAVYMLFLVCLVFVVTLAPSAILSVTWYILFEMGHGKETYYKLRPFNVPFKLLRLTNYAVNIILYGLTGKEFRTELIKLICCHRRRNRQTYLNVNMI